VNNWWFLDDKTILHQFADILACRREHQNQSWDICRKYSRELAIEISLTSFGSSQIFLLPHLRTLAAKRFWDLRDTILEDHKLLKSNKSTNIH
jgi:hypothetical protein